MGSCEQSLGTQDNLTDLMSFNQFLKLYQSFYNRACEEAPQFPSVDYVPTGAAIYEFQFNAELHYYYKGQINSVSKKPQGLGIAVCEFFFYKGFFQSGVLDKQGFLMQIQGVVFEGEFKSGKKHGKGVCYDVKRTMFYQGGWHNDLKHGQGFLKNNSGSCFQGLFQNDLMKEGQLFHFNKRVMKFQSQNARALLQYLRNHPACERYEGQFKQNLYNGKGVYHWEDGKYYVGQWQEGCMHGFGEFFWPDGKYYLGNYFKDQKSGQGIMLWNANKIYEGKFDKGLPHGLGCLYLNRNFKYGVWEGGNYVRSLKEESRSRQQQNLLKSKFKLPQLVAGLGGNSFKEVGGRSYFQSQLFKTRLTELHQVQDRREVSDNNSISLDRITMHMEPSPVVRIEQDWGLCCHYQPYDRTVYF